ncbi:unnamed protein product, partial [marine sediment metagenome]
SELIGIATWNFREGSLASRIQRFAELGFDAISLRAGDATALCRGSAPEVEDVIAKHSLAMVFHPSFVSGGETLSEESLLTDFELYLAWHNKTGALHTVNYEAAYVEAEDGERDYQAEAMRPVLKKMLAMSDGAGFSVGVKDWPRRREQLDAVAALKAYLHFGVLVDLGYLHLVIRRGLEPNEPFPAKAAQNYLDRIALPINELHVRENDGVHPIACPPTSDSSYMSSLAEMLRKKGCKGISTIEFSPESCGL